MAKKMVQLRLANSKKDNEDKKKTFQPNGQVQNGKYVMHKAFFEKKLLNKQI